MKLTVRFIFDYIYRILCRQAITKMPGGRAVGGDSPTTQPRLRGVVALSILYAEKDMGKLSYFRISYSDKNQFRFRRFCIARYNTRRYTF